MLLFLQPLCSMGYKLDRQECQIVHGCAIGYEKSDSVFHRTITIMIFQRGGSVYGGHGRNKARNVWSCSIDG